MTATTIIRCSSICLRCFCFLLCSPCTLLFTHSLPSSACMECLSVAIQQPGLAVPAIDQGCSHDISKECMHNRSDISECDQLHGVEIHAIQWRIRFQCASLSQQHIVRCASPIEEI